MKNVTDFSLKSDTFPVFVHILLTNLFGCDRIANGKNKKEILDKALTGPITPFVPASILQLHPDVTVIYSEN